VFHGYKRRSPCEQIAQQTVEIVRIVPLPRPFGDEDPTDGGVARPGNPQPDSHGDEHPQSLRVRHAERVENPQRAAVFRMHRRMEGHAFEDRLGDFVRVKHKAPEV
jgi:hypothetical protein